MQKNHLTLLIGFMYITSLGFSQVGLYLGVSKEVDVLFNPYAEAEFDAGTSFEFPRGKFTLFLAYQYAWNIGEGDVPSFNMTNHNLGVGVKFRFSNATRFYNPILRFTALTEIASPYRGSMLGDPQWGDSYDFYPYNKVYKSYPYQNGIYQDEDSWYKTEFSYAARYYLNTPLILSLFYGNELKLKRNFYITFFFGFLTRWVHSAYGYLWGDQLFQKMGTLPNLRSVIIKQNFIFLLVLA